MMGVEEVLGMEQLTGENGNFRTTTIVISKMILVTMLNLFERQTKTKNKTTVKLKSVDVIK